MKKTILLSLVVMHLVCAISFGAYGDRGVVVNVPFAFVAGGRTLAPGYYLIEKMSGSGQGVLVIRNAEGVVIQTALYISSGAGVSAPGIEFIKAGQKYFLSVVKMRETIAYVARSGENI